MGDGAEYLFWSLSPLSAKEDRVRASLAFLQDHTEGDALNRIQKAVELKERDAKRIDTMIPATMDILSKCETPEDRREAFKILSELNRNANATSQAIAELNQQESEMLDRANKESRFIVRWMLTQEPNSLDEGYADSIVTPMNCIDPVMVILGFDTKGDDEVPAPLESTSAN